MLPYMPSDISKSLSVTYWNRFTPANTFESQNVIGVNGRRGCCAVVVVRRVPQRHRDDVDIESEGDREVDDDGLLVQRAS